MKRLLLLILVLILWLAAACTPKASPTQSPPPKVTPASPAVPGATPATQTSELESLVAAAKKEGKINAYSFHLIGDVGIGVARAFKDKYGIEIESVAGPGMQLIERIRAEQRAKQGNADLLTSGASILFVAKTEGMTMGIGNLPVLQEQQGTWLGFPPLDPERHVLNFMLTSQLPIINTNLVKPQDEPTSWLDLLGPQWKGKMSLADPATIPNASYIYLMLLKKGVGKDYFVKLGQQDLKMVTTTRDISASVARGEVSLAWGASDATTGPFAIQGAPVKAIDMKEGIPLSSGGAVTLLNNGPHPNASRLFINWLLSQEGQATYTKLDPRLSVRKDVADPRPPSLRLIPKSPEIVTGKDEEEVGRIMRDRDLAKLILGK